MAIQGPIGPKGDSGEGRPSWSMRKCELCTRNIVVQCTRVLNFYICMNCEITLKNRLKLILNFE